ncbi:ABC transporter permease [Lichenicola cladoniae]|nr:ABC transporter permease [Lichenicola cladoniae]
MPEVVAMSGRSASVMLGRIVGIRRSGVLGVGIGLALLIIALCFLLPLAYTADPYVLHPASTLASPGGAFPLGTDEIGRDALARLLDAGRSTLLVAIPAAVITFLAGLVYGLGSGLAPRWLDSMLMRLLDAVLALPGLVVLIFFASILKLATPSLILLLGLISWPPLARLVRNETLAQRDREFIQASRQMGAGFLHIATTHLLRVMAPVLVVNFTFLVGDMILVLSALSFLGLGVQPPQTSWGGLLESALQLVALDPWWLILPPGLLIFASLLSASLIGQGLLARQGRTS